MDLLNKMLELSSLNELVGQKAAVYALRRFAEDVSKDKIPKPLLLYGPPGTGKTASVYAMAKDYGFNILEMSSSDNRSRDAIERFIANASPKGIFKSKNIALFDEIDELVGSIDRAAQQAIIDLIEERKLPVIMTANDLWDKSIYILRSKVEAVEFKRLSIEDVKQRLYYLKDRFKLNADNDIIESIAMQSGGDLRAAIIDLFSLNASSKEELDSIGYRNRDIEIFKLLDRIFYSNTLSSAINAINLYNDSDYTPLINWIAENIPVKLHNINAIYTAYQTLAEGTAYISSTAKRQYFYLYRYASIFIFSSILRARLESSSEISSSLYRYPKIISSISANRASKEALDAIAARLKDKIHMSIEDIERQIIPIYIKAIKYSKIDMNQLKQQFGMDEKNIDYLLNYYTY
ncbi:MAG: replication factor C large subunit [Candidatus Micrarchaeota archaeon]|nr:MAG: replication factor C large subunit [Candidatus Micrarchaeota archaeon]